MTPPIQGDGGRPRLEWHKVWRNDWVADFGPFRCVVFEAYGSQQWAVGLASGTTSFCATLVKEQFCDTIADGKLAAEAACISLLCSALAAFAGPVPETRAWNLAKFVRDLLMLGAGPDYADVAFAKPTKNGWIKLDFDEQYQIVPPAAARAYAADLLRAAELAEVSSSQAVHPGSRPAGEEGK